MNALRAFESAARHGSFSVAADELCVTPGAVAQHIKSLESWAGARLFKRHSHGVTLTELGIQILPAFGKAFDHLGEAVQSLRNHAAPHQISIAALPSVAQLWLSPRLPKIRSRHSDITISVCASEFPPNLKREQFDLSIFFEDLPGKKSHTEICVERIFPVCAPQLASKLSRPEDLASMTCLHDSSWSQDWNTWLDFACPEISIDVRGPVFSLYSLALEEAKNGAGILLAHESLVSRYIESGELVVPFDAIVELNTRLAIATTGSDRNDSVVSNIIESLLD